MSKITIHGIKDKRRRKLFRVLTRWMIKNEVGPRINIEIELKLTNLREIEKCAGICEWSDDSIRPRAFLIHIDNEQSLREQLRTLAHEMVHVRQYAKNELYDYQSDFAKTRFRNKIYDCLKVKYKDQPWEKEAYNLQTPILRRALKDNGIKLKEYI